MTQVTMEAVEQAERKVPVWEDFIDIFTSPSTVFARRSAGQFGVALLIVTLVVGFLAIAGMKALMPLFEAEFNRGVPAIMAKNPQITEAQLAAMRSATPWMTTVGIVVGFPISMLLIGLVLRVVGALFDASLTVKAAIMVAVYAQAPRIVQQFLGVVQGFVMAPESLTSRFSIGAGPARFLDINTASPILLALLERFDLFTLWATVLIAIGLKVAGRIPVGKATAAAVLVWVLGALFPLMGALGQMRAAAG